MQVWFNGRTSAFQAEYVGSIPITCLQKNQVRRPGFFCMQTRPRTQWVRSRLPARSAHKQASTGCHAPHHLLFLLPRKYSVFGAFRFFLSYRSTTVCKYDTPTLVHRSTKKGLRKIRRPVLMSTFNEYLFLFRKFLFLFFRNGEIQNAVLEACLDVFFCDLFTDIEASLH